MPRRRRPPVRAAGGFVRAADPAVRNAGFVRVGDPAKPSPDPWTQLPATGVGAPPVTTPVPGERPIPAPLVNPATGSPFAHQETAGYYTPPHVAQQQLLDAGHTTQQVHQAAVTYATQRLSMLQRIAHVAGDEQLSLILASNGDPLQVYAAASKRWAELARNDGYADPRMWLRDMLSRVPTAARPAIAQ